jgi:uncharacterized protein (DUF305 family)
MSAQSIRFAALTSVLALAAAVAALASMPAARGETGEQPFLFENQHIMDKMMRGMAPKPTGDVDTDFAAMMIPHHQGAIEMAVLELRYGRNEQLRRIAQEIIVDQQQEIGAMRLALGQPLSPSTPVPTHGEATSRSPSSPTTDLPRNPIMEMPK